MVGGVWVMGVLLPTILDLVLVMVVVLDQETHRLDRVTPRSTSDQGSVASSSLVRMDIVMLTGLGSGEVNVSALEVLIEATTPLVAQDITATLWVNPAESLVAVLRVLERLTPRFQMGPELARVLLGKHLERTQVV